MTLLAVSEAAERLGVSTRQVQHLVARGDLRSLARGVVDETSVERLLAVRRGSHTRAWAESTAWAAVALLSGRESGWLGDSQRSRLRGRLRGLEAEELAERARGRASVSRYVAHRSAGERLRAELVDTWPAAARLGLAATNAIDGYLGTTDLKAVVSRHGLIRDDAGSVTLRATSMDLDVVRDLVGASDALAALDLAESLDVRERRAGIDAIDRALGAFRG
ncbi:excisionase [Nocardioides marmoriginsengisoli]|nr:excisionase [Nocardioides marmoriginsengisoli]